jgi:hypothetical protein
LASPPTSPTHGGLLFLHVSSIEAGLTILSERVKQYTSHVVLVPFYPLAAPTKRRQSTDCLSLGAPQKRNGPGHLLLLDQLRTAVRRGISVLLADILLFHSIPPFFTGPCCFELPSSDDRITLRRSIWAMSALLCHPCLHLLQLPTSQQRQQCMFLRRHLLVADLLMIVCST